MGVTLSKPQSRFALCRARGDLDAFTAPALRQALARSAALRTNVVVDLSRVTGIDSSGLGVLVDAIHRVCDRGGSLVLCSPTSNVRRVLELVGVPRVVEIVDSVADARALLAARSGRPGARRPEAGDVLRSVARGMRRGLR